MYCLCSEKEVAFSFIPSNFFCRLNVVRRKSISISGKVDDLYVGSELKGITVDPFHG